MDAGVVGFESALQRRLWLEKAAIIPFEVSTAWITDKVLLESCRQFYHYVVDGYEDIYKYPEENYIDPLDPVFDSRPGNRDVIWDSMHFHRDFHRDFLMRVLRYAFIVEDHSIIIKNPDYKKFLQNIKSKYPTAKYIEKKFKVPFTFNNLMMILSRRGLVITPLENETIITSQKYPQMFLAAKRLYDSAQAFNKKTKRTAQCCINMDFRAIEDPLRKSNLEDIYYPLLPAEKVRIDELYDFAAQKTLKCKYKNLCGVREASFLCNKTPVLSFIWRVETGLKIRISLPLPMSAEHDLLLSRINELDNAEEIKDFCLHNLYECFYCSKTCVQHNAHKKKWIVLGHLAPKLTTSCWGFGLFFTLSDENLALTEKLVDMLTEIYKSYH